jgi:hypothetical protein
MKLADYPALYIAADTASSKAQKRFFAALAGNLVALTCAAAATLLIAFYPPSAPLQLLTLLASLGFTVYLETKQPQRLWYGARALAESIKTMTWRYAMRAEPYEGDDGKAKKRFVASLRKIVSVNREISIHAIALDTADQVSEAMTRIRALPLVDRIERYKDNRIADQHAWYVRKSQQIARAARLWFYLLVALNAIAIALCIARIYWPQGERWPTDIFIIAAGAVLAWMQTNRYQELATSYTLTAHEIGILRVEFLEDMDERKFSRFVADAENAFSREHTQWHARREAG